MKGIIRTGAVALMLSIAGCATIMSGTQQPVTIRVANADGANCEGTDAGGYKYFWKDTPSTAMLYKGYGPVQVICKKKGYAPGVVAFSDEIAGAFFGNIILGGIIGGVVDGISGAAEKYPHTVELVMKPLEGAEEDKMEAYEVERKRLEAARKAQGAAGHSDLEEDPEDGRN